MEINVIKVRECTSSASTALPTILVHRPVMIAHLYADAILEII